MPKKNPLVSYVIRTKNEAKFIGKVLHCLYDQTYKNFEVIIVDSGSTDGTLKIVKQFPIKLIQIKQEEFNYSYALNLGISNSKGKLICILSGHSIPTSDEWLALGVKVFEDKNVAGLSGYYTENPVGYYFRPIRHLDFLFNKSRKDRDVWLTNSNSLVRKKLWREYPFDEKLEGSEDHDWALEMLARDYNIVKTKDFAVFHCHYLLRRPGYIQMLPMWRKWNAVVEARKRPRKSFTRLKNL